MKLELIHKAENNLAVKKKVAAGHLQKILGKHMMTSQAYNDERRRSQFTKQKTI